MGPAAIVAISVLILGTYALNKLTSGVATAADVSSIDQKLDDIAKPTPTTAPAPPPTTPSYDYLTCTHQTPGDRIPCVPVLVWPLTDGAVELIGLQKDPINQGQLNTANTRLLLDQIRQLPNTDTCSLWLAVERDANFNSTLTIYPSQERAPQGAVKLCDCAPRGTTEGTFPTEGAA